MLSARGSVVGHGPLSPTSAVARAGGPSLAGIPLKYLSLVTLTVQNSLLTILLHYSRISVSADEAYSPASAVLVNEILKGLISTVIAFKGALASVSAPEDANESEREKLVREGRVVDLSQGPLGVFKAAISVLRAEVFSADAFKLSIPAALYVVQNNLQFVAASNLDVPTFQVTYNLKILTTAVFSVLMLRRKLSRQKWVALFALAAGVAIVQLQSSTSSGHGSSSAVAGHEMNRLKGLLAVASACATSGLAGVYFELVLKGSTTDLWIRNVQLSLFSLLPALFPVYFPNMTLFSPGRSATIATSNKGLLANFGFWAWAVVLCQVVGGLVTAVVIKYSDNILKGFATSLAIIISFCAGIILFDFRMTLSFLVGATIVIGATYLYNLPDGTVDRRPTHQLQSPPGRRPFGSNKGIPPSSAYFGRGSPNSIRDYKVGSRGLTALRPNMIPKREVHTPDVNLDMPSFVGGGTSPVLSDQAQLPTSMPPSSASANSVLFDANLSSTSPKLNGNAGGLRNGSSVSPSPVVDYGAADGITMMNETDSHLIAGQKRTY